MVNQAPSLVGPQSTNEVYSPDRLIAGDYPIVTDTLTIASGQVLQRGALLGVVTGTGYGVLSLSAASDGSQTPYAVLADNIDTSATGFNAATPAAIYLSGEFNTNAITFGTGWSAASAKAALRDSNIYLKTGFVANVFT